MIEYKIIKKENVDYKFLYEKIIKLYENDTSEIANVDETMEHFKFILNSDANPGFVVLLMMNNEIVSMVNFFEYNNIQNRWCEFSIFVKKEKRRNNYSQLVFNKGIEELKKYKCNELICGIECENEASISFHKKNDFVYSGYDWNELDSGFPINHLGYIYNGYINSEQRLNGEIIKAER